MTLQSQKHLKVASHKAVNESLRGLHQACIECWLNVEMVYSADYALVLLYLCAAFVQNSSWMMTEDRSHHRMPPRTVSQQHATHDVIVAKNKWLHLQALF